MVLIPSTPYTKAVVDMFGGYDGEPKVEVHGVAHITGGGIPGKLGRMLKPSGLGALIHSPMTPTGFMLHTQQLGNVSDREAYKTWNMRTGMIIATPDPMGVQEVAVDHGITCQTMGEVIESPEIIIVNRGAFNPFNPLEVKDQYEREIGPEELVFHL